MPWTQLQTEQKYIAQIQQFPETFQLLGFIFFLFIMIFEVPVCFRNRADTDAVVENTAGAR